MIDFAEFEAKVEQVRTDDDVNALIAWLMDAGYGELDAREMIQFELSVRDGEDPPL